MITTSREDLKAVEEELDRHTPQALHSMLQNKQNKKRRLGSTILGSKKKQLSAPQPVLVSANCPYWSYLFHKWCKMKNWKLELLNDWINQAINVVNNWVRKAVIKSISQRYRDFLPSVVRVSFKAWHCHAINLIFSSTDAELHSIVQPAVNDATRKRKTYTCSKCGKPRKGH